MPDNFYMLGFPGEHIWKCRYYNSVDKDTIRYTKYNQNIKVKEYRAINEQELREKQNEGMDDSWIRI